MENPRTEVLFLNKEDVDSLITYPLVVEAVERAFHSDGMGHMCIPNKEIMPMGGCNALFAMPGCLYDMGVAGVKWTNFYPTNTAGLPTCWAHILLLSHVESGQPYAILDATSITNYRTAGGHAVVAAKYLAKPQPKVLGVMGAGAQGLSAIRSFTSQFNLDQVRLFSTPTSQARLRPLLEQECPVPVVYARSGEELADGCDIIITATTSQTPLLSAAQVPAGCLVTAMFSFHDLDPTLTELADKWVLGHMDSDRQEILEEPDLRSQLNPANVYGTLGEIICGKKPGRQCLQERIVFSHMGMASLDIAVAEMLVGLAHQRGVGQVLRLT